MLIFEMMHVGGVFRVKGTMSLTFLQNLEQYIEAWTRILPEHLHPTTIIPDHVRDDRNDLVDDSAIALFSQGLDASFAVYRHAKGLAGLSSKNIQAGLYVKGYDAGLLKEGVFEEQVEIARHTLEDLGIHKIYTCETNYPDGCFPLKKLWKGVSWRDHTLLCHIGMGTGLASFWSQEYKNIIIGSAHPWETHLDAYFGYRPDTDPLLSSRGCRVYEEGWGFNRTEKANLVKNWKVGMEHLRVCWFTDRSRTNCGKCEKCVRTQLNFLACGVKFNGEWNKQNLFDLTLSTTLPHYNDILAFAEKEGRSSECWVQDLKAKMADTLGEMYKKGKYNPPISSGPNRSLKEKVDRLMFSYVYRRAYSTYYRYKVLSFISFGKKRRHYQKKRVDQKNLLREMRQLNN
jgi:hypothetical protein